MPWPRLLARKTHRENCAPSQPNSPALLAWYPPFQSLPPPSYLLPPALRQSSLHTPQAEYSRLGPPPAAILIPSLVKPKGAGQPATTAGELTRSPSLQAAQPGSVLPSPSAAAGAGNDLICTAAGLRAALGSPEAGLSSQEGGGHPLARPGRHARSSRQGPSSPSTTTFGQLRVNW